jgi:hypothetical protein
MDYEKALAQVEQLSQQSIEYLSDRGNLEKLGKVTAISVAVYVVVNVNCNLHKHGFHMTKFRFSLIFRNYMMHSWDPFLH